MNPMLVFYDFMNPNFKFVDQNRFIFSTCRLNAVKQVNTTPHRIKLQQVYGGSVPVSASSQVNLKSLGEADVILCQNDVSVVQEETPSVGLFTFMDSEEAQRFYQSLQQGMTLAAQRRLEVRENSFVSPQAVLSDHSQASTSVACPRLVNHEAKAHAMAVNGLRFIPFEGSPLNIQCIYCRFRTPLSQDESWDPIREHRQSQNASAYGCPFAPLS
ncbi:uncharacterized protein BJ171DRAFT_150759 [Polychytrium aggregatum]|uniref:uncharacterized protein n=1 Tax=Polychytrium aggregatum TaxID=110093 RepID=UPI0022FE1CAB|nr:uncharacterized protein BJ171DRAFT_150759 [Polychytrium aggregatum]KAI9203374.1 hypothetical protein BJ171DRAFT_150759 [Polychytrium aggregatum]